MQFTDATEIVFQCKMILAQYFENIFIILYNYKAIYINLSSPKVCL
jgi:hypothetical protein